MTDLAPDEYRERRAVEGRLTVFANANRGRTDLPRTLPECRTLGLVETTLDAPLPPPDPAVPTSLRFVRTGRPGQGSLGDEPTTGLELVLISPRDPAGAQALRDWADFVHLRHIAEAAVPGFRMITPWVNEGEGPRFLHLYELHTDDPEGAFQAMTPAVARRLGGEDSEAYRAWAWHPQLRIDYVNTFARVSPP
jgi:hypothetical protein